MTDEKEETVVATDFGLGTAAVVTVKGGEVVDVSELVPAAGLTGEPLTWQPALKTPFENPAVDEPVEPPAPTPPALEPSTPRDWAVEGDDVALENARASERNQDALEALDPPRGEAGEGRLRLGSRILDEREFLELRAAWRRRDFSLINMDVARVLVATMSIQECRYLARALAEAANALGEDDTIIRLVAKTYLGNEGTDAFKAVAAYTKTHFKRRGQ
jgi:hypothetical protein